ncbi:MAG TPA: class I SAM-dependent methyltransferase [Vicinamibacterales bacterium]|nr:class I SAM-dependent methyltransferase [Vicinamibacterales bacterium]
MSLEETLRRLKQERDEADRRYNEALTALDAAVPPARELPRPLPAFDEHQLGALNEAWNILPGPPPPSGLQSRIAGFVWRVVAPYLQKQLTFNSLLVDHLNRTVAAEREAMRVSEQTTDRLREQIAALVGFHSRLILYLQQITAYVDTKDRDAGGATLVLNAALSGATDAADRRWESLSTDMEARARTLEASQETLRTTVATSQQIALSLKRELERLQAADGAPRPTASVPQPAEAPGQCGGAFAPALDAAKYVGFEDLFRGSREVIRERLSSYVPFFDGSSDVLDVGCGRGEFLELLGAAGIRARGIDLNPEMADLCRSRGLDVAQADAVGYLSSLPDAALGGIFAAQVVEHLQPSYLLRFLELAFHKLRPGGRIVLETLNPACWTAFFDSYIRDITHVWPLHPDTLKYLVLASGFTTARVEYRSPVPEHQRLQRLTPALHDASRIAEIVDVLNENVERLNARMYTFLDYAIVGERL